MFTKSDVDFIVIDEEDVEVDSFMFDIRCWNKVLLKSLKRIEIRNRFDFGKCWQVNAIFD